MNMSKYKNLGGPAYPVPDVIQDWNDPHLKPGHNGMSLLDRFACDAMHAELLSAGSFEGPACALAEAAEEAGQTPIERIAFNAYRVAQAMLKERARVMQEMGNE